MNVINQSKVIKMIKMKAKKGGIKIDPQDFLRKQYTCAALPNILQYLSYNSAQYHSMISHNIDQQCALWCM